MVRERFFFFFYCNLGKRPTLSPFLSQSANKLWILFSFFIFVFFVSFSFDAFIHSFHLSPFFFLLFKTDLSNRSSSLLSSLLSFFNLFLSFLFLSNQHNTHQNLWDLHTNRHFCLWSLSVCPVKTATRANTTLRFIYGLFHFVLPS